MPAPRNVVIDTNVIIDAFVRSKDVRSRSSIELIERIEEGKLQGILPAPVLIEVYYVVLDVTHDPHRAQKVLRVLLNSPHFTSRGIEVKDAYQAIEYYRQFNYFAVGRGEKFLKRTDTLSLVDCLILAVGRAIPGAAVVSNEGKFFLAKDVEVLRPRELVRRERSSPQ
jgi:predicted nucleic acid-binding protein